MNFDFALNTILVFILIIFPGTIFRRFYFQGEFTKQYGSHNWTQFIFNSIIPGIVIQGFSIYVFTMRVKKIDGYEIKSFLNNISSNNLPDYIFDFSTLKSVLFYFGLLYFFSIFFAQLSWSIVRFLKLDRKWTLMRFHNHWHYYFKGEIRDFKEFKKFIKGKVLATYADVLTSTNDGVSRLYSGLLAQYTISRKESQLENIYLTEISIYKREDNTTNKPKRIPGDCMVIPYSKIENINLRYVYKERSEKNYDNLFSVLLLSGILIILTDFNYLINLTSIFKSFIIKMLSVLNWGFIIVLLQSFIDYKIKAKKLTGTLLIFILLVSFLIYRLVLN